MSNRSLHPDNLHSIERTRYYINNLPSGQKQPDNARLAPLQSVTELSQFLIKKDLILSRLANYDDNPMFLGNSASKVSRTNSTLHL